LVLLVAVLVAGALAQVVVGEEGVAPVLMVGASAQARGRAAPLVHPLRLDSMAESLVHVLVGEDREALDALMAAASALIGFALAPFVVLDPKSCRDRVLRSAVVMGIGHLALAIVWGVLFPANIFMGLFWALGHAGVGAVAGALAGLISWFWGDDESRGRR
jgi:hypothetical protein